MNRKEAQELVAKYTENTATPTEKQLVEQYFLKYLEDKGQLPDHTTIETANVEMWNKLQMHIGAAAKPAVARLWPGIAVAASLLMVLGTGLFFGSRYLMPRGEGVIIVDNKDVLPGKNTATLTLADGRMLQLKGDKAGVVIAASDMKYNDGTAVEGPETAGLNEMLTATTPRGGTYQVTLADGTQVWLNAASSLKFPSRFTGRERIVELTGEAYFEVAKTFKAGQRQPFIVVSNKQQLEVLGTHFNINSYLEEGAAKTTLLEGAVRLSLRGQLQNNASVVTLQPNQQSVQTSKGFLVKQVNAEESVAWKNGYFDFNEEKLESIMDKIARWYDVTVSYASPELKEQTFTGNISRFNNVSAVLKKLALSDVLHFKIEGRNIIVSD